MIKRGDKVRLKPKHEWPAWTSIEYPNWASEAIGTITSYSWHAYPNACRHQIAFEDNKGKRYLSLHEDCFTAVRKPHIIVGVTYD